MAASPAGIFQVGVDILSSTISAKTGTVLCQTGDVVTQTPEADNVEIWGPQGFVSRPPKPNVATHEATQGVVIRQSDYDVCIGMRDLRGQKLAGSLDYGETCMFGSGEDGKAQGRVVIKKNGNVSIYTANGNELGGQSVTVQVNSDGSINLASQYGAITLSSSGINMVDVNGAAFQLSSGNAAILGSAVAINGGSVTLGGPVATGVGTQLSLTPLLAMVTANCAATTALNASLAVLMPLLVTFFAEAVATGIVAGSPSSSPAGSACGAVTALATAAAVTSTALGVQAALPLVNFSQNVTAS